MPLPVCRTKFLELDDVLDVHDGLLLPPHHEAREVRDLPAHLDTIVLQEQLLVLGPLAKVGQDATQEPS